MRQIFTVLIEQGESDAYIATVPALKSCYTQADSIPDVLEKIKEVIELCLEADEDVLPLHKFVGVSEQGVNCDAI